MTIYSIKDGNYGEGSGSIVGGADFEGTLEEVKVEAFDSLPLEGKKLLACDMVDTNYTTYCSQGLSFTNESTEYIIDNNEKTRNNVIVKWVNVNEDLDTHFNWTMDSPRIKLDTINKAATLAFLGAVRAIISANEELLRDKKTAIDGMNQSQVDAYIASPTYPTYGRTV